MELPLHKVILRELLQVTHKVLHFHKGIHRELLPHKAIRLLPHRGILPKVLTLRGILPKVLPHRDIIMSLLKILKFCSK